MNELKEKGNVMKDIKKSENKLKCINENLNKLKHSINDERLKKILNELEEANELLSNGFKLISEKSKVD